MRRKLIRYFPFFVELDVLDFHLREIIDVVDHIIISESDLTHNGRPKPFVLEGHLHTRFALAAHKITYVRTKLDPNPERIDRAIADGSIVTLDAAELQAWSDLSWKRDRRQKTLGLCHGAERIEGLSAGDLVVASDLDEVLSRGVLDAIRSDVGWTGAEQRVCGVGFTKEKSYFRQFDIHMPTAHEPQCCVFPLGLVCDPGGRASTDLVEHLVAHRPWRRRNNSLLGGFDELVHRDAGWHLSYFWDTETMPDGTEKIRSFSDSTVNRGQIASCFRPPGRYHRGTSPEPKRRVFGRYDLEAETAESGVALADTVASCYKLWHEDPLAHVCPSFRAAPNFAEFVGPRGL